jgi:uncharacterized protein YjiS (DUF1127 family)
MQHVLTNPTSNSYLGGPTLVRRIGQYVEHLRVALLVARERRALMQLDDSTLKDIGLSRSQAFAEASRPFGDIPANRTTGYR